MTSASPAVKARMLEEQQGRCHWCDAPLTLNHHGVRGHRFATVDHIFPKGDPRRATLYQQQLVVTRVLACLKCNTSRGSMPYDDFLKLKRPEWREV